MCGIAGIFDVTQHRSILQPVLKQMSGVLTHRGPDEDGCYIAPGIGLAHRRLAIIDISSGQQPLFNANKSLVIVFNGEIYNYRELTVKLKARGYQFSSHSDTETILHAFAEWGEKCVNYLRGMFAFCIWDNNRKKLFLARDRLGIKPLFYSQLSNGVFVFASELKALMQYPGISNEINLQGLESYFALGYVSEPQTIYQGIYKLPAGHCLTLSRGKANIAPWQYWDIPFKPLLSITEVEAQHQFVERLREAISIRMVAEVPLGAFLSGGVDSSAVVALMAGLQQDAVNTCSIGFKEDAFNESHYAQKVAELYKTNHYQEIVGSNDFGLLDKLSQIYDEPFADSSAIPTYRVCELAKKTVTVALSGDGADELLSGYRRHQWHMKEERIRSKIPLLIRRNLFGVLGSIYPKADWAPQMFRAKTTLQALSKNSVDAYLHTVSQLSDEIRNKLYGKQLKRGLGGYHAKEIFYHHAERAPTDHPLSLIQYLDLKTYLVDDILTKVDRASMAHSLEVRVPILDHQLVEWISNLPADYKLQGNNGKAILKKVMEPYLPNDILYRKKMGFSIPLAQWFRGPLQTKVKHSLLGERMLDTHLFNDAFLKKVVIDHQRGTRDYSVLIWSLLMFDGFLAKNGEFKIPNS